MRRLWLAVGVALFCGPPAHAAFEALRAVSSPAVFDPLRPAVHFWQAAPGRLVDIAPRVHLAGAQPYGLSALRSGAANITVRPGTFGLGVSLSVLGESDYYSELVAASGIAWQPIRALAVGAILEYGRVQAGSRFGELNGVALGAGIRAQLGQQVSMDFAATGLGDSPANARLFTPRLQAGITYEHSGDLCVRMASFSNSQWSLGETVKVGEHLALSADLITSPLRLSLGLLISAGALGFDFLYRDHPELGADLAVGVLFYT